MNRIVTAALLFIATVSLVVWRGTDDVDWLAIMGYALLLAAVFSLWAIEEKLGKGE